MSRVLKRLDPVLWFALAVGVDVALFVLERAEADRDRLFGTLLLGPMIACVRLGRRPTAVVGLIAFVLACVAGVAEGTLVALQDLLRLGVIALGSCVAVWAAHLRERAQVDILEARRRAFLGEADSLLAASLDFREVAERIVALPVPELADSCRFDRRRTGDEVVLSLFGRRAITVPLSIRGEPVGALRLEQKPGSRDFDAGDHRLARDLAARCTLALDNAALYEEARNAEAFERHARARASFLAEASEVFDASLDEEKTLQAVARLSVRNLADHCVVVLAEADGSLRRAAWAGSTPEIHAALTEMATRFGVGPRPTNPIVQVVSTGEAQVYDHAAEGFKPFAVDEEHERVYRTVQVDFTFIVPLNARGRTRGAIIFGLRTAPAGEERRRDLLGLFQDVANRAALAIDSARLYAERSHVARVLQQSLLPPALPDVPGVEIAARYRPAGEGNEVGGDFYDCFQTIASSEWAIAIGDVCGKGPEAAVVTALARHTLRASVLHTRSPGAVLAELNEALLRHDLDHRFCTVGYVGLLPRPDGAPGVRVAIASGGHPLPLLRRAGDASMTPAETVGEPGTLLGIVPDPELPEAFADLDPGDVLVLYTDGVTEASPLDDALSGERLAELLGALPARSADDVALAVEEAVLQVCDGKPRDDVAIVVIRVADPVGTGFPPGDVRVQAAT